jgi:integrase
MAKLTEKTLAGLKLEPGKKDRLVFDAACPGLGVRITSRGTRAFLVQWTDPAIKRKVREPLGIWGSITLEQAREAARAKLGAVAKGIDVKAQRERRRAEAERERAEVALTFNALLEEWRTLHLRKRRPRYAKEAERALRHAFPHLLGRPAARITRAEAVNTLDRLAEAGKAAMAGRTLAYARACFRWAEKRGKVPGNPFERLPIPTGATERERVLTDAELGAIWRGADALGHPFAPFVKLLILTLQRREEVAAIRWSELSRELTVWSIPGARMKNGKAHDVHLAPAARDLLQAIPRLDGSDFVFTTTGRTPISGISKAKARLDSVSTISDWRLHDLRRTGVSRLAAMGFDSIVADKVLAHKPAKLRGVASVYQRHEFLHEREAALHAWATHVLRCASSPMDAAPNVIPLSRID